MSRLTEISEEYIVEYIFDKWDCDFEEGLLKNFEFEFETQEYNCFFAGMFFVKNYDYDLRNEEELYNIEVSGELTYSPKDYDDENEKTENINFTIEN